MKGSNLISDIADVSFKTEEELVAKIVDYNRPNLTKNLGLIKEVDSGRGIADIVYFNLTDDWRKYSDIAYIESRWVYPFIKLPFNKPFSKEAFSKNNLVSLITASRILKSYQNLGLCDKYQQEWIKTKSIKSPISNMIAIEAKKTNWKRALIQAKQYRDFCYQSWVVLDESGVQPAISNKYEFARRHIGLATMNISGELNIVANTITIKPRSQYRFWYVTSLILKEVFMI